MRNRSVFVPLIVAVLGLALALPAAAGARPGRVRVAVNCYQARAKPRQIIVACADGNFYFNHLRWRRWSGHRARGRGVAHANSCTPNCARGRFHHGAARVRLFRPRRCRRHHVRVFTRIAWTLPDHVRGIRRHGHGRLSCPLK